MVFLIFTSAMGYFAGGWLADFDFIAGDAAQEWPLLGAPPQPAIRIRSADFIFVYVETANGVVYRCPTSQGCEEQIEIGKIPRGQADCTQKTLFFRPVVDSLKVCGAGAEAHYILLEDGSVRGRVTFSELAPILEYISAVSMGAIVGLVSGIAVLTVVGVWRARCSKPSQK
jgi:hypothetical protein